MSFLAELWSCCSIRAWRYRCCYDCFYSWVPAKKEIMFVAVLLSKFEKACTSFLPPPFRLVGRENTTVYLYTYRNIVFYLPELHFFIIKEKMNLLNLFVDTFNNFLMAHNNNLAITTTALLVHPHLFLLSRINLDISSTPCLKKNIEL